MLTQMERHPYPFACTTNAPELLDPATARRFLFKVRFLPMTSDQIAAAFHRAFGMTCPEITDGRLMYYGTPSLTLDEANGDKMPFSDWHLNGIISYSVESRKEREAEHDKVFVRKALKWGAWIAAGVTTLAGAPVAVPAAAVLYAIKKTVEDE
jgi:hypothetical protein